MLRQRPSGVNDVGETWTHQLYTRLVCDANGITTTKLILALIKKMAAEAQVSKRGQKLLCIYYTGHGEENRGNWCFRGGSVKLQEIVDQFDAKDKVVLRLYCDCCYSGVWVRQLMRNKITAKGRVRIHIYSACDYDEIAKEGIFSDLLKGQFPSHRGCEFLVLHKYKDKYIEE